MIKTLSQLLPAQTHPSIPLQGEWDLHAIVHEECLSYVACNTRSREAMVVDPKLEAWDEILSVISSLEAALGSPRPVRWLAVVDTHTHADHISAAARLADRLSAPLVMHEASPSRRPH